MRPLSTQNLDPGGCRRGVVALQCFDLTAEIRSHDLHLLSSEEQERAARFRHDCDRRRYLRSHVCLHRLVARACGAPAERLRFTREAGGRPRLRDYPDLWFSLSRSGDLCAVALARRPIGIDIERLDPELVDPALEAQFLHRAERRHLATMQGAERAHALIRFWTQKEAVAKAIGAGLSIDLSAFRTAPAGGRVTFDRSMRLGAAPAFWRTFLLNCAIDHVAAVATPL